MASLNPPFQLETLNFGLQVIKKAQIPPNSGQSATLFTVAGGSVLVTYLFGRVTTALNGTTGTIALGTAPTVGTANTAGISAAAVVGGAEIGTKVGPVFASGVAGTLAVGGSKQAGGVIALTGNAFMVDAGTITITTAVATMTGAIDWYLGYVSLDAGASVS